MQFLIYIKASCGGMLPLQNDRVSNRRCFHL